MKPLARPLRSSPTRPGLAGLSLAVLLSGCALVTPEPISEREVRTRVQADQFKIYSSQDPVFKPITFSEAIARSLSYNLDYRLKLMESALNRDLAEVANYDMLPNLLVSAGYTSRNSLSGSRSFTINPDGSVTDSNTYSGGQDKSRELYGAEFSWSVLDFGVGYYRAKQQANQYLIAEERRRRVVQTILQDVRSAYWRAVGAQRLSRTAEQLMVKVRSALERSREAEAQGLLPPKDALSYQRVLLDAVSLLNARRQDLDFAKRELAALMNITPGTDFTLSDETEPDLLPMPINIAELEELALINRPELHQEDYQARITAAETRRQLLHLFPNLSLNVGKQYDSNRYLYRNNWLDTSVRLTFNLFKALSLPAMQDARDAQVKTDDTRRMALSMAILTQVRVALERYQMSLNDLDIAKDSFQVDQRALSYSRAALTTRLDAELELIRAETRALNSEFQRYAAYAAAQTAFARVYSSVGLEVVPDGLENASLDKIGAAVAKHVAQIENETFVRFVQQAEKLPAIGIRFHAVEASGFAADAQTTVVDAIRMTLKRNKLEIATETGKSPTLHYRLQMDPARNGVRRARWLIELQDGQGKVLGSTQYASTLPVEPAPRLIAAFAEAATVSSLRNITAWLQPGAAQ